MKLIKRMMIGKNMKFFATMLLASTCLISMNQSHAGMNDISADVALNMSVEKAWLLWTTEAGLETWLGVDSAKVSPQVGGSYELYFSPDHTDNNTEGCKVIAAVPNKLLAFEWKGPSSFSEMNTRPFPTWVTISFESVSENTSVIHFRHSGWNAMSKSQPAHDWFQTIWLDVLSNLGAVSSPSAK